MKKWYVDDDAFMTAGGAVDYMMETVDFEDEFDDFLRSEYGDDVEICGELFDAVESLKDLDYTAYGEKFDAWKEGVAEELEMSLNRMETGSPRMVYGYEVEVRDEDEEKFKTAKNDLSALGDWLENSLYAPLVQTDIKTAMLLKIHSLANFIDELEERVKEEE